MRGIARIAATAAAVPVFLVLGTGMALAHQCTNASKPADSGVRVTFGPNDTFTFNDPGLERQFLRDPEGTGERFSGLIGFDMDGDGVADFSTYIVGPNDELPQQAQQNGAECRGILYWEDYVACVFG